MHQEIIEEIRNGNLAQLDRIYLEVKQPFFSFARKQFPTTLNEEIEDIYQDSVIDFYKNIQRGVLTDIEISFSSYIIHIGKMKLIKHAEKKQKVKFSDVEQLVELPIDTTQQVDWVKVERIVDFIFTNTDESCKSILELFYYRKMSMDEIAKQLGYKNGDVVKAKKSRCITRITESVLKMFKEKE